MKIIETKIDGLEQYPKRTIYYFGPKTISCTELKIIEIKNLVFEIYKYDIKGNGRIYLKIFDSGRKELFEKLTICLSYNWGNTSILFHNDSNEMSNKYFHVSISTECRVQFDYLVKELLSKFVLVVEKTNKYKKGNINEQFIYAYLIFIFFNKDKDMFIDGKIRASKFLDIYKNLQTMHKLISSVLTDNAYSNHFDYCKDEMYYKVLHRFVDRELKSLEKAGIYFDYL